MYTTWRNGVVWPNLERSLWIITVPPWHFPDFTRGEWNVVKGYKHAYASPEDEKIAEEKAEAFTAELKKRGAEEWAEAEN